MRMSQADHQTDRQTDRRTHRSGSLPLLAADTPVRQQLSFGFRALQLLVLFQIKE